jgi:enoyl-CoA hydratase/carnithine racemase
MSANDEVLYEVKEGGIAWLTFNRPEARNAMTFGMYDRLGQICVAINSDDSVKALVLRGAGDKAFVSGTDISQFRDFSTAQQAIDYEARMDRVFDARAPVRGEARASPPRAIFASARRARSSDFPSRARWGTPCRRATTRGSPR